MAFDPPSRAAGCPPIPELVQFLKDKNLDGQLEKLLEMSETDLPQKASEFGCGDEDVEQLGELLRQERDRRAREPSVGGRLAEVLKNSGSQLEAHGKKVHVPQKPIHNTTGLLIGEHQWAMRVYAAEIPPQFVEQKPGKDKIILLLGDRTSKQDLINLMLNYNVGMKLQEPQLVMNVDQGTAVHSAIAAFKIPAILDGRVESGLTIINAPDFDNNGMEDRIASQVEQFLTERQYTLSGVCCLVQESQCTSENYKKAFKAVLKELDQDIAERTMLCIMSGESSDADAEKLKDIWQPIRDAGILYQNWSHFKWPLLLPGAANSQARQDNSDYLAQFFHSLSRKSQQTGSSKQKDGTIDPRKKLLDILERNPHAAQTDSDAQAKVDATLQYASEAARRIVVIGGTGAGKSAFCGLLDGSLKRNPNVKGREAWSANFTLGHKSKSETNVPELRIADWLGTDAEFPILIMDTPGMLDTKGVQKDEEHLRTIAGWINGLKDIHLVVILVGNEPRMNQSLTKILLKFQERFGPDLWAHAMVVVNKWNFDGDDLPEEFEQEFRKGLQEPIASGSSPLPGQTSNAHVGLGLTEEDCNKMLPFGFMNFQYRSDQAKVAEEMKIALDKMKAKLKELEPWPVRVFGQSKPLNDLINAVRNFDDSATLKRVFETVNPTVNKPTDLTEEKLHAVEKEILRREDLEAAEESLTKAVEAFNSFKAEGTSNHAETFVQKLDMAMKKLPDALMNLRISRLKPSWDMLKAALEGKRELSQDLPMELQQKVDQLLKEVEGKEIIKSLLAAWNIKLSKEQLNQLYTWGVSSDEDLAQHISQAGMNNFPRAAHQRAKILKEWNGLKDSSTANLKWTDANDLVKKLEKLIRDAKKAEAPQKQIQEMEAKLKKAEEEEKRERKFTTIKVDMAWRPFGSLAGERTRLKLQKAPQAFKPESEIVIKFKDGKEEYVRTRGGPKMEFDAGVQLYILDLECDSRIPSGDLNATLVFPNEECTFSGEMRVPGRSIVRLPFDDKHWYCIRQKEICLTVAGTSTHAKLVQESDKHAHHAQFRFEDPGKGEGWFRIFVRHSGLLVTNHSDYDWNLEQHFECDPTDHNRDWQYWTCEEAGNGTYLIKSKKDAKVIYLSDRLLPFVFARGADRRRSTGEKNEKFTIEKMDRI